MKKETSDYHDFILGRCSWMYPTAFHNVLLFLVAPPLCLHIWILKYIFNYWMFYSGFTVIYLASFSSSSTTGLDCKYLLNISMLAFSVWGFTGGRGITGPEWWTSRTTGSGTSPLGLSRVQSLSCTHILQVFGIDPYHEGELCPFRWWCHSSSANLNTGISRLPQPQFLSAANSCD